MLKHLSAVLFPLLFFPIVAFSQDMPPGKWWKDQRVMGELNLNESQTSQLEDAYKNSRLELIQLKGNLEKEYFELENLMDDETFDETATMAQYQKMKKAQDALSSERFKFILEVRKILGYEKFNQLKSTFGRSRRDRFKFGQDHDLPRE